MNRALRFAAIVAMAIGIAALLTLAIYGAYNSYRISAQEQAAKSTTPTPAAIAKPAFPAANSTDQSNITPAQRKPAYSSRELDIYKQLQDTCSRWTMHYNQSHDEQSRINMNVSCRDAADYAQRELKLDTGKPNFVAVSDNATRSAAKRISQPSEPQKNPNCAIWEQQLEQIQAQLRAGYTEPRGNYLRERRRQLTEQMQSQNC